MRIVYKARSIDLWRCPRMTTNTSEPVQWWCGNDEETAPCQTGPNASFVSYTAGSAQGIAPITSSNLSPSAIDTSTKPTTSFSSSSSTAVTSIDDTNTPTQDLHESTLGLSSTAKDDDAPISRSPTTAAISSSYRNRRRDRCSPRNSNRWFPRFFIHETDEFERQKEIYRN